MGKLGGTVSGIGHYVVTLVAIVCVTLLAITNKVDGNTAVAIIAVAGGIAGGVGAATAGGNISAANTPIQQPADQPLPPQQTAAATNTPTSQGKKP